MEFREILETIAGFVAEGFEYRQAKSGGRACEMVAADEPDLVYERLFEASYTPVCSPKLIERLGAFDTPEVLRKAPLIHDDSLSTWTKTIGWPEWLSRAGVAVEVFDRSQRFTLAGSSRAIETALADCGG